MKEIPSISVRSYEQIGSAVRRVRKLQGLSQMELAKKAGLRQATISQIEMGNSKSEVGTLMLVFAALQLDLVLTPRPKSDPQKSLDGLF